MSDLDERLKESLKRLHSKPFHTILATVIEVDRATMTVDVRPLDESQADIFDVRLRAAVDGGRGVVLLPAKGSTVLVSSINDNWNSAYVAMVSEVDLITIQTAKESLKEWQSDLLDAIGQMVFATNQGPTIELINALAFTALKTRLNDLFLD